MPRQKSDHVDSAAALAQRLKDARERVGISQRALARGICTPAYVSRLEKGERIPSLQLLRRLADRLQVDADALASGAAAALDPLVDAELALRLGEHDEAETIFRTELDSDRPQNRARALRGLGELAFARGDHRGAIELLEQVPDASAAEVLGRAYAYVGELETAIGVFERALADAKEAVAIDDIARFEILLANALIDAGRFGRAAELLGSAIAEAGDAPDPLVQARLWWSQSRLHVKQGEPESAARYARRALEILELTDHASYTARAHQLLAHIEVDRGKFAEALVLLDNGYALVERTGNRYERGMFRLEQARALTGLGRLDEAAAAAMEASTLIADASPSDAGHAYGLVAQAFAELGDNARAIELYELADETLPATSWARRQIASRHADLLESEGRKDEALALLKQAMHAEAEARLTS